MFHNSNTTKSMSKAMSKAMTKSTKKQHNFQMSSFRTSLVKIKFFIHTPTRP